ncbi:PIF1 helicase, partial [Acromyrmex heyeri]
MDIQFIGEKSEFLNSYLTKYATKKCNIDFTMIDSNKPLASILRLYVSSEGDIGKSFLIETIIERVIAIKIGAKVMIRRNIDVTLGLVNGTISNVVAANRFVDGNRTDSIKIVISDNKEITITKVDIKFEVFHKMMVHWKQFPCLSVIGITIYKSQGITYKNAMRIRQQILKNKISNALTDAICVFAERNCCNILTVRSVGECFEERTQQVEFLKWETINGNCNECKMYHFEKENRNRIDFIRLSKLNLYTLLNSKKIIF